MQSSQIMKKTRQIRKWKRTKKKATTTRLVPCLPDEIMFFHILPKVPAKCLLRLNCVSKLWYNTIHDPMFIATHLSHGKSDPSFVALLRTQDHSLHYLHLKEEAEGGVAGGHHHLGLRWVSHFPIIGHCNGLTCTRSSSSPESIQISNPTTREILTFPQPSLSPLMKRLDLSYSVHGFGFDSVTNEYKVIQITYSNGYCQIWVYTLGTNSWRNISATCNYPRSGFRTHLLLPFYTTKALYWMNNEHRNILSFDLHLEKFQLVPCTKIFQAPGLTFCDLYELGGRPSLLFHRKDNLIKNGIQLIAYILTNQHSLGRVMHTKQQPPQQGISWVRVTNCNRLPFKPDTVQISAVSPKQFCLQWKTKDDFFWYMVNQKKILKKNLPGAQQVVLVKHVENLLSLKTFVPVPSAGDFKVKYASSRKAKHESPTAASSDQLLQQQPKRRRRCVTPCWFPITPYFLN